MKPEDNYLDYLFDSAREEAPQYTFEEATDVFVSSDSVSFWKGSKNWLINNISLNSFLVVAAGIFAVITFSFFPNSQKTISKKSSVTNTTINSSIIEKEIIPTKKELLSSFSKVTTTKKEKQFVNRPLKKEKTYLPNKIEQQPSNAYVKINIPSSPRISSIEIRLREIDSPNKPFVVELENKIVVSNSEDKTVEETFNPWVSGPPSEMSWKIKKRSKAPFLNESERVLQQCMNTKYLEQIFDKSENGYFEPLNMVTNYAFDENYFVQFRDQRVRLISEKLAPDFDPSQPHINIKRFKINKNKAIMVFDYKDYHVIIQLRRVQQGWKRHRLKVKKNKDLIFKKSF